VRDASSALDVTAVAFCVRVPCLAELAAARRLVDLGRVATRCGLVLPTISVTDAPWATGGFSGAPSHGWTATTAATASNAPEKAPAAAQDSLRGLFVRAASLALGSPSSAAQWAIPP
jgi:hypothetical protein